MGVERYERTTGREAKLAGRSEWELATFYVS